MFVDAHELRIFNVSPGMAAPASHAHNGFIGCSEGRGAEAWHWDWTQAVVKKWYACSHTHLSKKNGGNSV